MFSFINFAKDIRIISCLFVKFVLYTAGFLGEGTLPFLYMRVNYRFRLVVFCRFFCILGPILTNRIRII